MAVEKETQLEAWLEENMPEPGGGNPNYVETIEGTLANPWGNYSKEEIIELINSNNATCYITISQYKLAKLKCVFLRYSQRTDRITFSSLDDISMLDGNFAVTGAILNYRHFVLETSDNYSSFIAFYNNEQIYQVPDATTPCVLTIIHHPMPEN